MTFPRYCHNDDDLFGDPCSRYGDPQEKSDLKQTPGHGARYYCRGCGIAPRTTEPDTETPTQ